MISVAATRKHRMSREYGGIAWNPDDGLLYAVLKYYEGVNTTRSVFTIDPVTGLESETAALVLEGTDSPGTWNSIIQSFVISAGTFRALMFFEPMQTAYITPELYRKQLLALMQVWDLTGAQIADMRMAAEDIYLPTSQENPYRMVQSGIADTDTHDTFVVDGLGRLLAWRPNTFWYANGDPAKLRDDPLWTGNFTRVDAGLVPRGIDSDYIILATSSGEIYWYDISGWNTSTGVASCVFYKSFQAFDAKSIQDLTIDRNNDVLWVLTKDNELQKYDLQPYDETQDHSDNTCKAIRSIQPPPTLDHGNSVTLTFEILDMWGVRTYDSTSVEIIACATTEANTFYGSVDSERKVTVTSDEGLIEVEYQNLLTETPTAGPETIIARVT